MRARRLADFNATEEYIDEMLSETAGNINFTLFLTLMGERLSGTSPRPAPAPELIP